MCKVAVDLNETRSGWQAIVFAVVARVVATPFVRNALLLATKVK